MTQQLLLILGGYAVGAVVANGVLIPLLDRYFKPWFLRR